MRRCIATTLDQLPSHLVLTFSEITFLLFHKVPCDHYLNLQWAYFFLGENRIIISWGSYTLGPLLSLLALFFNAGTVILILVHFIPRDMTFMQEELGDLIHSVIEKDLDQETACRVTGMLIEIDLVCLHEILADDSIFRKRVRDAVQACKSTS